MVNYVPDPDIRQCVHNLGNQHHQPYAAHSQPNLIRVKIGQLSYQVSHQPQGKLSAHISHIIPFSHYPLHPGLIKTEVFFCSAHLFPLLCFNPLFSYLYVKYNLLLQTLPSA